MNPLFVFIAILLFASAACALPNRVPLAPTLAPTLVPKLRPTLAPTLRPYPRSVCLVVTATESLHLRVGPSRSSPAIDYLLTGVQILGEERRGNWWLVYANGQRGFVHARFVEECGQQTKENRNG